MNKNGEGTITIAEAARLLGTSPQSIRIGLCRGIFKFGAVIPMKENVYIIYRAKFEEETGIKTKGEQQ